MIFSKIDTNTNIIQDRKKYLYFCLYCIIVSIIFLSYLFTSNFVFWVAGIIALSLSFLLFSLKYSIYVLLFFLPNENLLKISGISSSPLSYIFMAVGLFFILFNVKKPNYNLILLCVLHGCFVLITIILTSQFELVLQILRFIIMVVYLFQIMKCENISPFSLVKTFVLGVCVAIICGILYTGINGTLFDGYFGGVSGDRNYFNALISPTISLCLIYLIKGQINGFKGTLLFVVCIVLCLISVILSNSRTCFIALLFPVIILLFYLFDPKRISKTIAVLILMVILVFVLFMQFKDSVNSLLDRFTSDNIESGNGRFDIWEYYFDLWRNSGLFGILFGNGNSTYIYRSGVYSNVVHNTVIEYLYATGVLGALSILLIIIYSLIKITNNRKLSLVAFIPFFNLCFCYIGIDGFYSNALLVAMFLCFIVMYDLSKPKKRATALKTVFVNEIGFGSN